MVLKAVVRISAFLLVVTAWQLLAALGASGGWFSSPALIVGRVVDLASDGELTLHMTATFEVTLLGLTLGTLVGAALGIVLGLSPRVAVILEPYVLILYTLPRIALAPMFIMYLGVDLVSKVAFTFSIVVFVVVLNIHQGVRAVDRELVEAMRSMRATRVQLVQWVVLPSIVPWLVSTVRVGIGLSLVGAVVAEQISSSRGVGWYMQRSAGLLDATGVLSGALLLAVSAALINGVLGLTERRLLGWRS